MDADVLLARKLQAQFDNEAAGVGVIDAQLTYNNFKNQDDAASLELARKLQQEFENESANVEMAPFLPPEYRTPGRNSKPGGKPMSCVSEEWETIDPTPDLHALFLEFNQTFFWGKLLMCEVKWSPRMYKCAGICRYFPRERFCTIGISIPLLKLRPRKDLVETLLHEMIHAFLFVTDNNDDHDGHGPEFHKHMYRINAATGASISVYHTFHDEVELYKTHWWRCDGPCTKRPPFYGFVKRTMNRAPGPTDRWWGQHQQSCGGTFIKVKEPEGYGQKKGKKATEPKLNTANDKHDIRKFFGGTPDNSISNAKPRKVPKIDQTNASNSKMPKELWDANEVNKTNDKVTQGVKSNVTGFGAGVTEPSTSGGGTSRSGGGPGVSGGGGRGNIFGFGGTSFSGTNGSGPSGRGGGLGMKTNGKTGTKLVKPGQKIPSDNSSGGSLISPGGSDHMSHIHTTGSGNVLGSKSSTSKEDHSARDAVRRRWANVESSSNSKSNISNSSDSGNKKQTLLKDETNNVSCPVCTKLFSQSVINNHLDSCLGAQEDFDMDDGDDDALLAATIIAENSYSQLPVVVSDSDDDEPLIKRRPPEDIVKSNDNDEFEGLTDQDDQDILASLEDKTVVDDGDMSMFACPICDTLLSHGEMFSHLDRCTKTI